MQIVIPMSGFGERFRRVGYDVPKPLIRVDGKPIIAHVVDLFPGETDFVFICNKDHLANPDYHMAEILRGLAPNGTIVPIGPHSLGPVNAVLQAAPHIDPDQPVIVNYCDFTCYWHYDDFKRFVVESDADGCVPAYRGFHPHSLGSTFYAYMRHEGLWMTHIQEKMPFTDAPLEEYASSGTYYFKSGALCLEMLRQQMADDRSVNGEYYVSLAYQVMAEQQRKIAIYELQHFMQWGTPEDLRTYQGWSKAFRRLSSSDGQRARHDGAILLPMAGLGKRFSDAGYTLPKPLVPVSGRPMVIQAVRDLPDTAVQKFVLRRGLAQEEDAVARKLRSTFTGARVLELDGLTEGQAITTQLGLDGLDPEKPVTVGACDNGILYDVEALTGAVRDGAADLLVWIVRGHADGIRRPEMFGWVTEGTGGAVTGTQVKQVPGDPATAAMITGTFTFRRAGDLGRAVDALVARDGRVNGEFYLDSVIDDCLAAGLKVALFEVDAYIGWGTPVDLQTFEYWQSCFHKWPGHPYRLERDRRVPAIAVKELAARYAWTPPPRPRGIADVAAAPVAERRGRLSGTAGEVSRFLPVGATAALIDVLVYSALVLIGAAPAWSKALSFVAGAVFAYHANRRVTFRSDRGGAVPILLFGLVYGTSFLLNVGVNASVLAAAGSRSLPVLATGWFVATACSAAANFLGMKLFVFGAGRGANTGQTLRG